MTQIGLQRLEGVVDTYQPGAFPPRLYQSMANQFSRPQDDEDLGGNVHELVGHEVPATTEEMRQTEEEAEGENRTRAGRARKPTQKASESSEQAKPPVRASKGGGHGRVGRGGRVIANLKTYREFIRKD